MIPVWAMRYIVPVVAGIAVVGAALLVAHGIHKAGEDAGRAEVRAEWNAANEKARAQAEADRKAREADALVASRELAGANAKAREWEAKWRREVAKGGPYVRVVCPKGPESAAAGAGGPAAAGGPVVVDRVDAPVVRLTAEFVRRYDGAWTGPEGKPVFQYPGGSLEASVEARPLGVDDILVAHGENASRCSETSRQLGKLIDLIERLRAQ